MLTVLAAHRAGLVVAVFPLPWRQAELTVALNRTGARAIVTTGKIDGISHADLAMNAAAEAFSIRHVLAYAVARRTRELGVRLALGATRPAVVRLVLREALILVGAGALVGVPVAGLLGRLTRSLLFGVEPFDLPSVVAAVLLLLLFAVLAATLPARRASRLDPIAALRAE